MASSVEQLTALESLFLEFNTPKTTNHRKHEIESTLISFVNTPQSWQACLFFLENTSNDYVIMFCCNVMEAWIVRKWQSVAVDVRLAIRSNLERLVVDQSTPKSKFARNKIIKTLVFIGRSDWPTQYETFLDSIFELCTNGATVELGLTMLLFTSEEFNSLKDDISADKRKYLKTQLGVHIPKLIGILNEQMLRFLEQIDRQPLCNECGIAKLALECIAHLFSWIEIQSAIDASIIKSIFRIASLGYDAKYKQNHDVISISNLSLSSVIELLSKRCIPPKYDEFVIQVFKECYVIMDQLASKKENMSDFNSIYIKNVVDFLRVLVSEHMHRLHNFATISQLLRVIVKFSYKQDEIDVYLECVEIWDLYIDKVIAKHYSAAVNCETDHNKLKEGILEFMKEVLLKKCLFKTNHSFLDQIDDSTLSENKETDWMRFIDPQVQIIVKTDCLYPGETFSTILILLDHYLAEFASLLNLIDSVTKEIQISSEIEFRNLHYTLRDLTSLIQIVGALSTRFTGDNFMGNFSVANELLSRFIFICSASLSSQFHELKNLQESLRKDFIELHAGALSTLNFFCSSWMVEYFQETRSHVDQGSNFYNLIAKILDAVIVLYSNEETPALVIYSASHLLLTIFSTLKPGNLLLNNNSVKQFYAFVSKGNLTHFSTEVELLVARGLSDYLILPWSGIVSQQWETRSTAHEQFVASLLADFAPVKDHLSRFNGNPELVERAKPTVIRALKLSIDLIESLGNDGNSLSKQIVYASLSPIIESILQLLRIYVTHKDVLVDLLELLVKLFNHLRTQMGITFVDHTINMFLPMFTKQQLTHMMNSSQESSSNIIERFFDILTIIAKEPAKHFKKFIPDILQLCLKQIYPIANQIGHLDTKVFSLKLLYNLMDCNWVYFFDKRQKATQNTCNSDGFHNETQFICIVEIFVSLFDQPELSLFENSLKSLQDLNNHHQLYNKKVFREKMMWPIVTILLNILEEKTKNIFEEQISNAIFDLVSIDFNVYFSGFLPNYLKEKSIENSQISGILDRFTCEKDMPSFIGNLKSFVIDLRFIIILKKDFVFLN